MSFMCYNVKYNTTDVGRLLYRSTYILSDNKLKEKIMFRKLLCLFMAVVFAFGIFGCANNNETSQNTTDPTNNLTDNSTTAATEESLNGEVPTIEAPKYKNLEYEEGYECWGLTSEESAPEMAPLTWEEKTVDGNTFYATNTPFVFDVKAVRAQLKNNSFMNKYYEDITEKQYEFHDGIDSSKHGYYITHTYSDCIDATKKGESDSSFGILASREPEYYNTPSSISLRLNNVNLESFNQDELYGVAKIVFGDNAEFLVYGKDTDGKTPSGNDLSHLLDMNDIVRVEESAYKFYRTFTFNEFENTVSLYMFVEVNENPKYDPYSYKLNDSSLIFESNNYTPDNMFSDAFGGCNPVDCSNFGVDYFKSVFPGFTHSELDNWSVSTESHDDGTEEYEFGITTEGYGNDVDEASFFYRIKVAEKDGVIESLYLQSRTDWLKNTTHLYSQKYIDDCIGLAKIICPGLEIPDIVYEQGKSVYYTDVSYEINGQEFAGGFTVNQDNYACVLEFFG